MTTMTTMTTCPLSRSDAWETHGERSTWSDAVRLQDLVDAVVTRDTPSAVHLEIGAEPRSAEAGAKV